MPIKTVKIHQKCKIKEREKKRKIICFKRSICKSKEIELLTSQVSVR